MLKILLFAIKQLPKPQSLTYQMIGLVSYRKVVRRSGWEMESYDMHDALSTVVNSCYAEVTAEIIGWNKGNWITEMSWFACM